MFLIFKIVTKNNRKFVIKKLLTNKKCFNLLGTIDVRNYKKNIAVAEIVHLNQALKLHFVKNVKPY